MKAENTTKIQFDSLSINEAYARSVVAAFLARYDPTVPQLADLKTAVSEAVTNCIVHAYPDRIGEIYIAASLSESNLVTIKVRDHGCGIADVQKAMEPLFTTGGSERAGLGFAVMQELMDEVRVTSRAGGGTTVRLRRRLSQKAR
jgi:stage II sporulation protein AB (anti-sigma F factor)